MTEERSPFSPMYGPPDFVNAEGVKWWSTASPDIWATEHPDGVCEYVGIIDGEAVFASPQLDAVGTRLALLKAGGRR